MAKARLFREDDGSYCITCPGCNQEHLINTVKLNYNGAIWSFNGDLERPTFSPSLHIRTGLYAGAQMVDESDPSKPDAKGTNDFLKESSYICHSFITDGRIQYLSDCTHYLKGQTVELPDRY